MNQAHFMKDKETITVAIFEKETDKQVCFNQKEAPNSAFDFAITELTGYLDTICQSKHRGTKEHFMVFVLINNDNPFRIDFEVAYGPKEWKKSYKGMPQFDESGTEPYQYSWEVPEDIDRFPTNNFRPDGKRIFLDAFPQARRLSTYEAINATFENRLRVRINRRLGIHPETGWRSYDSVEPDLEPVDYAAQIAKEDNVENVIKWALDEDIRRGGESSTNAIKEIIDLTKTACSREIVILRTIYEMENKKAECSDIVFKARELLQEYDRSSSAPKIA